MACPVLLTPVCDVVGGATSFAANEVISAIVGWFVTGASWLLHQLGDVITATTAVTVHASWFASHYKSMTVIGAAVALPMLFVATIQAVYQQSASLLVRAAFVNLPLALVLTGVAVQCVQLALNATDAMCTAVSSGSGGDVDKALTGIATALVHYGVTSIPTFVVAVGALLIVGGGFVLWLELLVRAASVYVAVLFLPLALASLVWPSVSHWCRRLVETLAALILSKFVIVAVLSLAVGAVTSGDGFASVLSGGALLLLASFAPFTLMRLVPLVEVGAVLQLEQARHRVRQGVTSGPTSAAHYALQARRRMGGGGSPGEPGTGLTTDPGAPGPSDGGPAGGLLSQIRGPASGGLGGGAAGGAGAASGAGGAGAAAGAGAAGGAGAAAGGVGAAASAVGGAAARGGAMLKGAAARTAEGARAAASSAAAGEDTGRDAPGLLPLGPTPIEWFPPGDRRLPPGDVPAWDGSPETVIAAIEGSRNPGRIVEPDGYGDVIPGVRSPLYGGTEPVSRFEPGPKDNWGEGWGSGEAAPAGGRGPSETPGGGAFGPPPFLGPPFLGPPFLGPDPGRHGGAVPLDHPGPGAFTDDPDEEEW